MTDLVPSEVDNRIFAALRQNVAAFTQRVARIYIRPGDRVLDVAPQDHGGVAPLLGADVTLETLDIDPSANTTYIGDICTVNDQLPSATFDHIVCTEVLEHTLQPFAAVEELWRLLKPGGHLFISTPFGFRIHGPLPDCWRFTEHGLRALLWNFVVIEVRALEDPDRPLMPLHYTVIAHKPAQ